MSRRSEVTWDQVEISYKQSLQSKGISSQRDLAGLTPPVGRDISNSVGEGGHS